MSTVQQLIESEAGPMAHGARRPGVLWWLLAIAATAIGGYGITLQDGRPNTDAVPGLPGLDEVHFVGGGAALLAGVWAFRRDLLTRHRWLHRRVGQLYVFAVLASGGAGLTMAVFSMGGATAHTGFGMLAVLWLLTTAIGWRMIHKGRVVFLHRRWMVRSYALCCAAITLRFELPLLVAVTGSFEHAYPLVAWLCWLPNVLFAEWWLARTDMAGRWVKAAGWPG